MSTSNFEGFVYGTKEQIDDIETKNENKIYIATDIEVATTDYVDEAVENASTEIIQATDEDNATAISTQNPTALVWW